MPYNPKKIESKWQKYWEEHPDIFHAADPPAGGSEKPKKYVLDMFPYPSGEGLHVGHVEGYTATDILSRYFRMRGFNVLHPMGWDAFGLPAENYAIKTKTHPAASVAKNVEGFRKQLKSLGFSYDWSREVNTTDPEYYRWTQWIFLKLFERGLAYQSEAPINYCPSCGTGLANEEVVDGKCERCGTSVEKRKIRQWMLKITAYADRLLRDLDELDWPDRIKEMQRNWIGRSEGAEIIFKLVGTKQNPLTGGDVGKDLAVFTTRPDTIFGATYVVLAPENQLIHKLHGHIKNQSEVEAYIGEAKKKSDRERQEEGGVKTGIKLEGITVINPANNKKIPVFVADYVLEHYGTGAIMAVPAHDKRDFAFAKKFDLPIIEVISQDNKKHRLKEAYEAEGIMVASEQFNGIWNEDAKSRIIVWLQAHGLAKGVVNYRLRDWIFSRQRYWGEPIPIVHCPKCGIVPLPEEALPLMLPDVKSYVSSGDGESPLAKMEDWVNTECPRCAGAAKRETNTMPQWAGSCWYYLRFIDPHNDKGLVDLKKEKYWMNVDLYVGGVEHAVLHLLYARFWHKFLFDEGFVSTKEPFAKLINQGLILGPDGQKMSKSRGNIINPDEVIENYGADSLRMYEMFLGPLEVQKPWDTRGIIGLWRFLSRVYNLVNEREILPDDNLPTGGTENDTKIIRNKTIKKVTEDIENFAFNTALSAMMEYVNELTAQKDTKSIALSDAEALTLLISPFAPHLAEELWQEKLAHDESIQLAPWPIYDEGALEQKEVLIVVQVNGKMRAIFKAPIGTKEEVVMAKALEMEAVNKYTKDKKIHRVIYVEDKLLNIVV